MDLFQLEESCWATLQANKMHMKSVFSVEVLRLWVHGMWCGVWPTGTNILVEPGISIFRVRRKEVSTLKRGAAGSSKLFGSLYQTSWSHIPWLYSQQTEVPITYHMPRFNIHEHQSRRTAHRLPQKICISFTSQNSWWCPPLNLSSTENL